MKNVYIFLFSFFFLLVTCHLLLVTPVHADADFDTSYTITYDIQDDGTTRATFNGVLTNKTSKNYVTAYNMRLKFPHITDLKAYDPLGLIRIKTTQTDAGYTLQLPFNAKVAGLNKKLTFTLTFTTTDIANHQGNIWEVNIPAMANQQDFNDLQIKVNVPATFGPASSIKPKAPTSGTLVFTKQELGNSGIAILFGDEQTYAYHLTYHLKNSNVFPIQTKVALPLTTNYQKVILSSLDPKPENVVLDTDGNWIATYYLLPAEKKTITASGNIILSLIPTQQSLSSDEKNLYLQPQQYWDVNNTQLQQQAQKLKTPQAIYEYVVSTLHYDFDRIHKDEPRLGGLAVMNDPRSAVCLEFTDLFISLARAAGIPAREVDGYAYTANTSERPISDVKDILHAWPEYYDAHQHTWIMVDPTWGNTTHGIDYFHQLDFDHVAFVIKGADSVYPLPAGGYKGPGDQHKKDVNVTFADPVDLPLEQLSISPITAQKYFSGFPISGQIEVTNAGHILANPENIQITSTDLTPQNQTIYVPAIPPFGSVQKNFFFDNVPFLTNRTYPFTIALADHPISGYIVTTPFLLNKEIAIGGGICVLLTVIIFITTRKTRRVHVPR